VARPAVSGGFLCLTHSLRFMCPAIWGRRRRGSGARSLPPGRRRGGWGLHCSRMATGHAAATTFAPRAFCAVVHLCLCLPFHTRARGVAWRWAAGPWTAVKIQPSGSVCADGDTSFQWGCFQAFSQPVPPSAYAGLRPTALDFPQPHPPPPPPAGNFCQHAKAVSSSSRVSCNLVPANANLITALEQY
jgi:hypothetical protein